MRTKNFKLVSVVVAFSFLVNSTVIAIPINYTGPMSVDRSSVPVDKGINEIFIPEQYGQIERANGQQTSGQTVILIKDAHCHYEAQHNIAKILSVLARDYGIDLVGIEGAEGDIDLSRFGKLEDTKAKESVADMFVKRGIVTGPEYLRITRYNELPFGIYGIEDGELYVKNFISFRKTYSDSNEAEHFIKELINVIDRLKEKVYSKRLLEFDRQAEKYSNNEIGLSDYIVYLSKWIDIKRYFDLFKTCHSIRLESAIDFRKVEGERAQLIRYIEKKLPKEELQGFVKKTLEFRLGKVSSMDYYSMLSGYIAGEDKGRLTNLRKYIHLVRLQSTIDSNRLFSEIDDAETRVKEGLFRDNIERQIDTVWRDVYILNKLFHLHLTRDDLQYFKGNRDRFTTQNLLSFISVQAPLHNIELNPVFNDSDFKRKVDDIIPTADGFYKEALQRDNALVENMLDKMEKEKKQIAVMVVGGFHADGITKYMEEKGISYIVISPKITKIQEDNPYLELMMDKRITAGLDDNNRNIALMEILGKGNKIDLDGAKRLRDILQKEYIQQYLDLAGVEIKLAEAGLTLEEIEMIENLKKKGITSDLALRVLDTIVQTAEAKYGRKKEPVSDEVKEILQVAEGLYAEIKKHLPRSELGEPMGLGRFTRAVESDDMVVVPIVRVFRTKLGRNPTRPEAYSILSAVWLKGLLPSATDMTVLEKTSEEFINEVCRKAEEIVGVINSSMLGDDNYMSTVIMIAGVLRGHLAKNPEWYHVKVILEMCANSGKDIGGVVEEYIEKVHRVAEELAGEMSEQKVLQEVPIQLRTEFFVRPIVQVFRAELGRDPNVYELKVILAGAGISYHCEEDLIKITMEYIEVLNVAKRLHEEVKEYLPSPRNRTAWHLQERTPTGETIFAQFTKAIELDDMAIISIVMVFRGKLSRVPKWYEVYAILRGRYYDYIRESSKEQVLDREVFDRQSLNEVAEKYIEQVSEIAEGLVKEIKNAEDFSNVIIPIPLVMPIVGVFFAQLDRAPEWYHVRNILEMCTSSQKELDEVVDGYIEEILNVARRFAREVIEQGGRGWAPLSKDLIIENEAKFGVMPIVGVFWAKLGRDPSLDEVKVIRGKACETYHTENEKGPDEMAMEYIEEVIKVAEGIISQIEYKTPSFYITIPLVMPIVRVFRAKLGRDPSVDEVYRILEEGHYQDTGVDAWKYITKQNLLMEGEYSSPDTSGARKNIVDTDHVKVTDEEIELVIDGVDIERIIEKNPYGWLVKYKSSKLAKTHWLTKVGGAYNSEFRGKTYIFVDSDGKDLDIAQEHEEFEIDWIRQGKSVREAHILAWGQQIIKHRWTKASDCSFIESQLDGMTLEQLERIVSEGRAEHEEIQKVLLTVPGITEEDLKGIRRFEDSVKKTAMEKLIKLTIAALSKDAVFLNGTNGTERGRLLDGKTVKGIRLAAIRTKHKQTFGRLAFLLSEYARDGLYFEEEVTPEEMREIEDGRLLLRYPASSEIHPSNIFIRNKQADSDGQPAFTKQNNTGGKFQGTADIRIYDPEWFGSRRLFLLKLFSDLDEKHSYFSKLLEDLLSLSDEEIIQQAETMYKRLNCPSSKIYIRDNTELQELYYQVGKKYALARVRVRELSFKDAMGELDYLVGEGRLKQEDMDAIRRGMEGKKPETEDMALVQLRPDAGDSLSQIEKDFTASVNRFDILMEKYGRLVPRFKKGLEGDITNLLYEIERLKHVRKITVDGSSKPEVQERYERAFRDAIKEFRFMLGLVEERAEEQFNKQEEMVRKTKEQIRKEGGLSLSIMMGLVDVGIKSALLEEKCRQIDPKMARYGLVAEIESCIARARGLNDNFDRVIIADHLDDNRKGIVINSISEGIDSILSELQKLIKAAEEQLELQNNSLISERRQREDWAGLFQLYAETMYKLDEMRKKVEGIQRREDKEKWDKKYTSIKELIDEYYKSTFEAIIIKDDAESLRKLAELEKGLKAIAESIDRDIDKINVLLGIRAGGVPKYYALLGIQDPKTANLSDIKLAYHRLAFKYHPDRNPGDKDAEERFKEVTAAYKYLTDPSRREIYDRAHGVYTKEKEERGDRGTKGGRAVRHDLSNDDANGIIAEAEANGRTEDVDGLKKIEQELGPLAWGIFKRVCEIAGIKLEDKNIRLVIVDTDNEEFEAHYGNVGMRDTENPERIKVFIKKSLLDKKGSGFILAHEFLEGHRLREIIRTRIRDGESYQQAYGRVDQMAQLEDDAHNWASNLVALIEELDSMEFASREGLDGLIAAFESAIKVLIDIQNGLRAEEGYDKTNEVKWHEFTHAVKNTIEAIRAMKEMRLQGYEISDNAILLTAIAGLYHDVGYFKGDETFGTIKVEHEKRSMEFVCRFADKLKLNDWGVPLVCMVIGATQAKVSPDDLSELERILNSATPEKIKGAFKEATGLTEEERRAIGLEEKIDSIDFNEDETKKILRGVINGARLIASLDIYDTREDAALKVIGLRSEFERDYEILISFLMEMGGGLAAEKDVEDFLVKVKGKQDNELTEELKKIGVDEKDIGVIKKAISELSKIALASSGIEQIGGTRFFYELYADERVEGLGVWRFVGESAKRSFNVTRQVVERVFAEKPETLADVKRIIEEAKRDKAMAKHLPIFIDVIKDMDMAEKLGIDERKLGEILDKTPEELASALISLLKKDGKITEDEINLIVKNAEKVDEIFIQSNIQGQDEDVLQMKEKIAMFLAIREMEDSMPQFVGKLKKILKGKGIAIDDLVDELVNDLYNYNNYDDYFILMLDGIRTMFGIREGDKTDADELLRKLENYTRVKSVFGVQPKAPVAGRDKIYAVLSAYFDMARRLRIGQKKGAERSRKELLPEVAGVIAEYLSDPTKVLGFLSDDDADKRQGLVQEGLNNLKRLINQKGLDKEPNRDVLKGIPPVFNAKGEVDRRKQIDRAKAGIREFWGMVDEKAGQETDWREDVPLVVDAKYLIVSELAEQLLWLLQKVTEGKLLVLYGEGEKEIAEGWLKEKGITAQFMTDYPMDKTGVVAMLTAGRQVSENKGHRIIKGTQSGEDDLMLMSWMAGILGSKEGKGIHASMRQLFLTYYGVSNESDLNEQAQSVLDAIGKGIISIIQLPPIAPFVKAYYNILKSSRETIASAA